MNEKDNYWTKVKETKNDNDLIVEKIVKPKYFKTVSDEELRIQNLLDEARTRHRTGPEAGANARRDAMGEIQRSVDEFDYNLTPYDA